MAKMTRPRRSRTTVSRKPTRKKSVRRPSQPARGAINLEQVTTAINATIKNLQPLKGRSSQASEIEALLQRVLGDLEAVLAGAWPPSPPPSRPGSALGDLRNSPPAASVDAGPRRNLPRAPVESPDMSTHGSGGGGLDDVMGDIGGSSNAPSMSTHGSGGGGRD